MPLSHVRNKIEVYTILAVRTDRVLLLAPLNCNLLVARRRGRESRQPLGRADSSSSGSFGGGASFSSEAGSTRYSNDDRNGTETRVRNSKRRHCVCATVGARQAKPANIHLGYYIARGRVATRSPLPENNVLTTAQQYGSLMPPICYGERVGLKY